MLFTRQTGNGGTYEYFACINRRSRGGRDRTCPGAHYGAREIEAAVIDLYETVHLPGEVQAQIRADIQTDGEE